MKRNKLNSISILVAASVLFGTVGLLCFSCATNTAASKSKGEQKMVLSKNLWKKITTANPISSNVFCADPTSVEYQGRLYVYGTNDHEQYLNAQKNSYEKIKSLVCFSTDDMVNWTYHGEINVGKIAPWIINSWAPSICSRVEDDGLTHFYLYFSNNGTGVGVITATSPLGPWSDPLKRPLIKQGMKGLEDSPDPFDPGVVIDDNGDGWLSFGAGIGKTGTKAMPGSSKIVKLGKDMISFASDFIPVKTPYHFEASELNFINGTYIYTYNNNWEDRTEWNDAIKTVTSKKALVPPRCSMAYLTSKNPLDSSSWEYQNFYFKNPGEMGFEYSNNHTHLHKFMGKWYLLYHTMVLQEKAGTHGGFRSMCVDEIEVDEEKVIIHEGTGTRKGVNAIKNLNPFEKVAGTTMFTSADVWYSDITDPQKIAATAKEDGSWIFVKNVDFGEGAETFTAEVKGSGNLEVRTDGGKKVIASLSPVLSEQAAQPSLSQTQTDDGFYEVTVELAENLTGLHDLVFAFSNKGMALKSWKFGH